MPIRKYFSDKWKIKLWGDRKFGKIPDLTDFDWKSWKQNETSVYGENQRSGIGFLVNRQAYKILKDINLDGKVLLEIGPGDLYHSKWWVGNPDKFNLVDISETMMDLAEKSLKKQNIQYSKKLYQNDINKRC